MELEIVSSLVNGLASWISGSEGATAQALATIFGMLMILHPIASFITKMTDTPKDDQALAWFYKQLVEPIALVTGRAKQGEPDKAPRA